MFVVDTVDNLLNNAQLFDLGRSTDPYGQLKCQRTDVDGFFCARRYTAIGPVNVGQQHITQTGPVYVVVGALYFHGRIKQQHDLFQQH